MKANKSKFSDKIGIKATAMIEQLDTLLHERDSFERTEMARCNQKLYGLLAAVYQRYEEATTSPTALKLTVDALTSRLKARGKRVQENSTALSVFVRYVFDTDRQRVFTYTRAIQAAKTKKIAPENFPGFVIESGGLEECMAMASTNQAVLQRKQQVVAAMPMVEDILSDAASPVLAEFKVDVSLIKNLKDGGKTFMIGTCDADGNVQVRSVIPAYSSAFEKWAKTKIAEHLQVGQQQAARETAKLDQQAALDKASLMLTRTKSATVKVGELH
jgi:hypothetical protein